MKTLREFLLEKTKIVDYSTYITRRPKDITGLKYHILEIPKGITPPKQGSIIILDGEEFVCLKPMSPDNWRSGRGAPTAKSMETRGIGYSVNCLPVGHPDLKNFNFD